MAKKKVTYWFGADVTEFDKKVKQLDKEFKNFSKKAKSYGESLTKAFTVPLAGIAAAATKSALNVDKALATIARGTGAQGSVLRGLENDWKKLAGQVGDSFEVSAKVLADYNTRLGLTGGALQEVSKQALDAADMLGEEINSVVTESAKAMQDWGVASGEMARYMDKIFVASQQTGVGMAALSTNMYKYGSALRQLGFDVDTTIATLAQFDKQGVNTELVMGSLRIALGKMAKAGISDATEAFKILTDQIKNAKNPTEATKLAIELFGAKAGPDMAAAIREGRFELGNLTEALNTSKGAIEAADKATETFADRWGETKNKISLAIAPLGKQILKIADEMMPAVEDGINDLNKTIAGMSSESQRNMLKLAGVFAVGGPLLIGIAAVTNAVRALMVAFVALAANPVGAALLVAGGTMATGYMFGQNLGKYLNKDVPKYNPYQSGQSITGAGELQGKMQNATGASSIVASLFKKTQDFDLNAFVKKLPKTPVTDIEIPSLDGSKKGSISEAVRLVQDIQDRMKYLGQDGSNFLTVLDKWQVKLKPLSEDWKKITDLKMDIRGDIARKAGTEMSAALTRMEEQKKLIQEAKDAATEGISKYYDSLQWENSQGLLGDTEYLDALKKRFADLGTELETLGLDIQNVSNWSEPMRQAFSEIQSVAGGLATDTMDLLQKQFESGTLTNAQYLSALEAIKTKFIEYPSVVKMAEEAIQAFNLSAQASLPTVAGQVQSAWDDMNMAIAQAPSSIGDAFMSAIRGSENLGDAMRNLLQDIGAVIVKAFIMKTLFGGLGGLGGGGGGGGKSDWHDAGNAILNANGNVFNQTGLVPFANGGIVNKPTLFPFASGVGLMGEAGAEAIMPLKRTPSGDLGVQADGGGGMTNITMNINAVDSQSFIQMLRNNKAAVESLVIENIYRNGSVRKAIQQGV